MAHEETVATSWLSAWLASLDESIRIAEDARKFAARSDQVSAWSAGEQLEHAMLADRSIVGLLERSAAGDGLPEPPNPPSPLAVELLEAGHIPRGRGPAPEGTLPEGREPEAVAEGLRDLRGRLAELETALPGILKHDSTQSHHVLGALTPSQWLRFGQVHHAHHAAIVRDILTTLPKCDERPLTP